MTFDFEVLDCNVHPTPIEHPQPVTTTMQPNNCFYLHLVASEHTGYNFILSHEAEQWADFWPAQYAMLEN